MPKQATLWYRWVKNDKGEGFWEFNHLEDDHCSNDHPTSKLPIHDHVWKGGKWAKDHVYLDQGNKVLPHSTIARKTP